MIDFNNFKPRQMSFDELSNTFGELPNNLKPETLSENSVGKNLEIDRKEEEEEAIKSLEKIPINRYEQMCLILAYFGEKSCSGFKIEYEEIFLENSKTELEVSGIKNKIRDTGLECETTMERVIQSVYLGETIVFNKQGDKYFLHFRISKDKEKIRELQSLEEELKQLTLLSSIEINKEVENKIMILHQKIGLLYGYPQTAVRAFGRLLTEEKREEIILKRWWGNLSNEEKNFLLKERVLNFALFRPSKENWPEELEIVRRWQKIIKDKTPDLYQEILKEPNLWEKQMLETLRDDSKK